VNLRLLHRRLAVLMGLAGLTAFAGGAGLEPVSATLAGIALGISLVWQPSPHVSSALERIWVPLAAILVARALFHVFYVGDDVVVPVVDLLLLLLSAECLRSLDAPNDTRIYALAFALLLASAAYRPGILFAVAFLTFVILGTVALVVGHLRRSAETRRIRTVEVGRGFLWGTAGLSVFTVLVSVGVFLTFPRVSRSWSAAGDAPTTSIAGFADEVSLGSHGSRIVGNPRVMLRVEFPGESPRSPTDLYWRGRSYDHFDGERWSRSPDVPPALAPSRWYEERWGGERVVQTIYATPLDVRVLFTLHPVLDVDAESRIQPVFDNVGDFTYWGSGTPRYQATSLSGRPSPEELRTADGTYTPARSHYLQLPDLSPRVEALADSLTRGLDNRYDRVRALRDWLRTEFDYTLDLPATQREAGLEHFLLERRAGHCEYFSTALAILLRSLDIPARNVNGFRGGSWSDLGDYLAVTQNEAHSWIEVWFPEYGWVPFDATPPGTAAGSGATNSFWPGRFLFDALQHRWGKWVLDYSLDTQWNLFERASALLGEEEGGRKDEGAGEGDAESWGILWLLLVLGGVAGGGLVLLRTRNRIPRASRLYLALRDTAVGSVIDESEGITPSTLVRGLEERSHPAAGPARALVDRYLRVRFGGEAFTAEVRREMEVRLRQARSRLGRQTSVGRRGGE